MSPGAGESAAPVLLLHGQPGRARDWNRVIEELAGRAATIAIDRPGWDGRGSPTDLRGNAESALAALDARAVDRATVVGHSLGASVAAWLAVTTPERVASLVLVAPAANAASLSRLDYLLALPIAGYLCVAWTMITLGTALTLPALRRRMAFALPLDDDYLRSAGRLLLAPSSWRSFAREQQALVRDLPALEAQLARIPVPTAIVAGTRDRMVPVASARRLSGQIPSAELVEIQGADHLLPQLHAGRVAEIIARYLPRR